MKYDSRKTLNENKNILISEQTWGDNVYKEKQPKITVDPSEMGSVGRFEGGDYQVGGQIEKASNREYISDIAANGTKLVLPAGTKIISRVGENSNVSTNAAERYCNLLLSTEDKLNQEKLNECKQKVQNTYNTKRYVGAVSSFTTPGDNKTYKHCWALGTNNKNITPLESQTFFSGYFTICNPPGEQYNNPKEEETVVDQKINPSENISDFGVEGGINLDGSGETIKVFLRGPK